LEAAGFPVLKTMESFDVAASSIPRRDVRPPHEPESIRVRSTHTLIALDHAAVEAGRRSSTAPPPGPSRTSTGRWPTTPSAGPSTRCCATT
jgi:hypothetical protein